MVFAGVGRAAVGASRSLARPTRRRLRALVVVVAPGHWPGAARCVVGQWPAASHVVCAPPTLVLRRCAASALRAGLPVPPPVGAPSARAPTWLAFAISLVAAHAWNTGGYRPKRPVSQRDRWLTIVRPAWAHSWRCKSSSKLVKVNYAPAFYSRTKQWFEQPSRFLADKHVQRGLKVSVPEKGVAHHPCNRRNARNFCNAGP